MDTLNNTLGFTDAELISAVGSIFLPLLIAFVMRQTWSDSIRVIVAYVCYFAYTFLTMWFLNQFVFEDGSMNAKEIVRGFLVVAVVAYTSFKLVWQPRGTTIKLEASTN